MYGEASILKAVRMACEQNIQIDVLINKFHLATCISIILTN